MTLSFLGVEDVCANTGDKPLRVPTQAGRRPGRQVLPGVVIFVSGLYHPTLQHMFIADPTLPTELPARVPASSR